MGAFHLSYGGAPEGPAGKRGERYEFFPIIN